LYASSDVDRIRETIESRSFESRISSGGSAEEEDERDVRL
jgi:hypothetical protein